MRRCIKSRYAGAGADLLMWQEQAAEIIHGTNPIYDRFPEETPRAGRM